MKLKKGEFELNKHILGKDIRQKRLPGPKTFRKAIKTNELLKRGLKKENELLEKGGLSKKQYDAFKNELSQRKTITSELINEIPDYKLSGRNPLYRVDKKQYYVEGTMKILVLLVEFENRKHQTEKSYIHNLLFSNMTNYSMNDYFYEVSDNKLTLEGYTTEWVTLGEYENYLMERNNGQKSWLEPNSEEIVYDAIKTSHESNLLPGFAYENFNTLIVVGAGTGFNRTLNYEDISPHRGPLSHQIALGNNLIDHYIMVNELPEYDVGGYCHEFAHELGLPDLYSDDGRSLIVGRWCLMGAGSYNNSGRTPSHLSAWCKWKLGWVDVIEVAGAPDFYQIPSINKEKLIYKISIPFSDGKEYYLIENRQQSGFDNNIPGKGLLIWHVNENGFFKGSPNINVNNLALTLKQADGKNDLEKEFASVEFLEMIENPLGGDNGDIFPGKTNNRNFSPDSNPSSDSYSGYETGIVISSISDSEEIMNALMGYEYIETALEKSEIIRFPLIINSSESSYSVKKSLEYKKGYKEGYGDGYSFLRRIE